MRSLKSVSSSRLQVLQKSRPMPTSPVGGGVDGPLYADYQDSTDQQQVAGAANSIREQLAIVQDTLTLDLAQLAGDIKLYSAKADTPLLSSFVEQKRFEKKKEDREGVKEEFISLLKELPGAVRKRLLREMSLEESKREPEYVGLEKALLQHAHSKRWAKKRRERFKEEEEEPEGDINGPIPKTKYLPIQALKGQESAKMKRQIEANTLFMLKTQADVVKTLTPHPIYSPLLHLIAREVEEAEKFTDLQNYVGLKRAKTSSSLTRETLQKERALFAQQVEQEPAARAYLISLEVGCSILYRGANLSALTEGSALLHNATIKSVVEIAPLLQKFSLALVEMGVTKERGALLLPLLLAALLLPFISSAQDFLTSLSPSNSSSIEKRAKAARSAAVQIASTALLIQENVKHLFKENQENISLCTGFLLLLSHSIATHSFEDKVFNSLTKRRLDRCAEALQEGADRSSDQLKRSLHSLQLSDLPHQLSAYAFTKTQEKRLHLLGVTGFIEAHRDLLYLAASFLPPPPINRPI